MRRTLPIAVAVACGLIVLGGFFFPYPQLASLSAILVEGATILAACALLLGILNLLSVHARRGTGREGKWGLSWVLMLALVGTLALGVARPSSQAIRWVFDYLYYPLEATMAALLAFFAVSAAYRAFRLRNVEAAILLVTSLVLLVTQLPISEAIAPQLPLIRDWLYAIPVTASMRGIILGIALGTIGTSLRILLAVDQPYAGR